MICISASITLASGYAGVDGPATNAAVVSSLAEGIGVVLEGVECRGVVGLAILETLGSISDGETVGVELKARADVSDTSTSDKEARGIGTGAVRLFVLDEDDGGKDSEGTVPGADTLGRVVIGIGGS